MAGISFVFENFQERSEEVSKYFIFLQNLQQGKIKLVEEIPGNNKAKERDKVLENYSKSKCLFITLQFNRIYYEKCYRSNI